MTVRLETEGVAPLVEEIVPPELPLRERRRQMVKQVRQKARLQRTLEKMEVSEVDSRRTMQDIQPPIPVG